MNNPAVQKIRRPGPFDLDSMGKAIGDFLEAAGIDMSDPHLAGTPERVAKAWTEEFLDGYETDAGSILRASFENSAPGGEDASEIVLAKHIPFHGLCPHHLLPFQGEAHIGYLPAERLAPFSALARLVDCFAHRLQIQETITREIAEALVEHLGAKGAVAVLESEQSCMTVRGVKRRGSRIVTTHFSGVLATRADLRRDFLRLVGKVD
jgi:GTP cyclohydrolase I